VVTAPGYPFSHTLLFTNACYYLIHGARQNNSQQYNPQHLLSPLLTNLELPQLTIEI